MTDQHDLIHFFNQISQEMTSEYQRIQMRAAEDPALREIKVKKIGQK